MKEKINNYVKNNKLVKYIPGESVSANELIDMLNKEFHEISKIALYFDKKLAATKFEVPLKYIFNKKMKNAYKMNQNIDYANFEIGPNNQHKLSLHVKNIGNDFVFTYNAKVDSLEFNKPSSNSKLGLDKNGKRVSLDTLKAEIKENEVFLSKILEVFEDDMKDIFKKLKNKVSSNVSFTVDTNQSFKLLNLDNHIASIPLENTPNKLDIFISSEGKIKSEIKTPEGTIDSYYYYLSSEEKTAFLAKLKVDINSLQPFFKDILSKNDENSSSINNHLKKEKEKQTEYLELNNLNDYIKFCETELKKPKLIILNILTNSRNAYSKPSVEKVEYDIIDGKVVTNLVFNPEIKNYEKPGIERFHENDLMMLRNSVQSLNSKYNVGLENDKLDIASEKEIIKNQIKDINSKYDNLLSVEEMSETFKNDSQIDNEKMKLLSSKASLLQKNKELNSGKVTLFKTTTGIYDINLYINENLNVISEITINKENCLNHYGANYDETKINEFIKENKEKILSSIIVSPQHNLTEEKESNLEIMESTRKH